VKLKAIENLASVGIKVTLVTTIVNSWNNDGIGSIVKFAAEKYRQGSDDRVPTGLVHRRDDETSPMPTAFNSATRSPNDARSKKTKLGGVLQPMRDWFPLSSYSAFTSRLLDMLQGLTLHGAGRPVTGHPICGIFTLLVVTKKTGLTRSLFEFSTTSVS
jgi:uncharacterized radical SAM superfamily Fe-S cluster-containing enzyme